MNDPRPATSVWQPICNDGGVHGMFEHRWTKEKVEDYVEWLDNDAKRGGMVDCGPHEAVEFCLAPSSEKSQEGSSDA